MIELSKKQKAFMDFELKVDNTLKLYGSTRTSRREANVFKLECLVGVDEAPNERDITVLTVAFVNDKKEMYVIQTFDDTTEIGKKMINAITEMRKLR